MNVVLPVDSRRRFGALSPLAAAAFVACGLAEPPAPVMEIAPRVMVLETRPMHVDRIYTSMAGPFDRLPVDADELDWITAYRTAVVEASGSEPMGDEFLCHSQLQLVNGMRLMVTATGADEVRFPEGFGMPMGQILRDLPPDIRHLTMLGMVLNNHENPIDRWAAIRATIEYYTDEEVGYPPKLRKLYKSSLTVQVEDLASYQPPPGASTDVATHCSVLDEDGYHWIVPPGTQLTRKTWSNFFPVDSTVHYATGHMHNHGVYMRMIDELTGEELWRTDVEYEDDRRQIKRIPVYSSTEGFPIYTDHAYTIEAYYDNTTDHDVDAMAQIDFYYHPSIDVNISYPIGPES